MDMCWPCRSGPCPEEVDLCQLCQAGTRGIKGDRRKEERCEGLFLREEELPRLDLGVNRSSHGVTGLIPTPSQRLLLGPVLNI